MKTTFKQETIDRQRQIERNASLYVATTDKNLNEARAILFLIGSAIFGCLVICGYWLYLTNH